MKIPLLLSFFIFIACFANGQVASQELYAGLEQKYWTEKNGTRVIWKDDEHPKHVWYSLSYLKLKNDSAFLDQSPVSIYKTDTIYSASDGGFFYYRGTFTITDTTISVNLEEIFCDYCGILMKKDSSGKEMRVKRTKKLFGKLTKEGIIINGFLFKPLIQSEKLISEDPSPYLKKE